MSDDDGGVEESINSSARIALTVAIQLGEKVARAYQEAMRDAQQREAALVRELTARFEAERSSARRAVAVVNDPRWWDKASIHGVARVAETAAAWKNADPQIARADAVIAAQAVERYGVDVATLSAVVRDTPSELDLAKQWASTSAPKDYHRHDEDRLTMRVGDSIEPNPDAERALVTDYRAAIAGDVSVLELSVAEEWKRAHDPTGFQDYRVETALAFDDNGRAVPVDPAVAEAARVDLIQEWRTERADGGDVVAADTERVRSLGGFIEAQMMMAEAERLDRCIDSASAISNDVPRDMTERFEIADELDCRVGEYERDAENKGTPSQTPDELGANARAQVARYRDDSVAQSPTETAAAQAGEGRARAARAGGEIAYDSAERRAYTAEAMRSDGVPDAQISARMTVDASFSMPARESAALARAAVRRTRTGYGAGRPIERPEQSR